MNNKSVVGVLAFVFAALMAGCGSTGGATPEATATVFPVVGAPATDTPAPAATEAVVTEVETEAEAAGEATLEPGEENATLSFVPATYSDESAGVTLEYPADWSLDPSSVVGVRGAQALLASPGSSAETIADGGTRVSIMTYIWDPKNDLDAWVAQRKTAWDASGFTLAREEEWTLADGRAAKVFVVQAPDSESITLLTTAGEDYLQVTGEGDLALAEEILRTVR